MYRFLLTKRGLNDVYCNFLCEMFDNVIVLLVLRYINQTSKTYNYE